MRLYLPHALAATTAVVLVPSGVVLGVLLWSSDLSLLVTAALGLSLSGVASLLGSARWARRPESVDISFGELMIWAWYRRRRAEKRLVAGGRLLAIDDSHPPQSVATRQHRLSLLHDLIWALEAKDPYTHGHSRRVRRLTGRIATAMGVSDDDREALATAAALHDIGKIRIPDRILRKPGALTLEERVLLQDHTHVGAHMVMNQNDVKLMLAVRHHHERWDGNGYPEGLAGEEIPLLARIIAVADSFDAMTSSRPYRASLGRANALEVIRAEAGKQFDPEVVEAFLSTLPARIPASVFVAPLLVRPGRALRELAMRGTRAGTASLTSAVGAVGATVVLGTSLIGPPVAVERDHSALVDRVTGSVIGQETDRDPDASLRHVERSADRHRARVREATGRDQAPTSASGQPLSSAGSSPQTSAPGDEPVVEADAEETKSDSVNEEQSTAPTSSEALGDGKPKKRRDCINHPGKGGGGGNAKHCGK
jgi:HD superfamily phosphohydrolase YqeK